mgnify:CR=1 FL=1
MSVFYDHLVGLDELHQDLLVLKLPTQEHYHLLNLIDSTFHHEILAICLDCLPIEHHESFIVQFNKEPNDESLLAHLKNMDPEIEEKIKRRGSEIKEKVKNDIKKVR